MGKILTPAQVESYHRDGIVYPVRVLTPAEAGQCLRAFEAYERARWGEAGRAYHDEEGREFLRQPQRLARWAYDLVTHERVLDAVEDLLGPDIMVWDSKLFPKPARSKSFVSWHQDGTYVGLAPMSRIATAWIALTDSVPENGALRVLPGSHRWGQVEHVKASHEGNLLLHGQKIEREVDPGAVVDVGLRAGEMSIHDMMLVHGSPANGSSRPRIGLSINYLTPDVVETNDERRAVILARGQDRFNHFRRFEWPAKVVV